MRGRILVVTSAAALLLSPLAALSQDEMEQQRCVWRCLADSKGNTDPAYGACVERYCTEAALSAPAEPVRPVQPARPAPPAPAAAPGQGTASAAGARDRMTVTVVQRALGDLGLYSGPVDGVYGASTAAAVESFRASRGLGPGGIDQQTVYRLRQESAAARR